MNDALKIAQRIRTILESEIDEMTQMDIQAAQQQVEQLMKSYKKAQSELQNVIAMFTNSQDLHMRIAKSSSDLEFVKQHVDIANHALECAEFLQQAMKVGVFVTDLLNIASELWQNHQKMGGQTESPKSVKSAGANNSGSRPNPSVPQQPQQPE